ncbi:hypothetical protein [Shinella sp.]|uniref:hypothetical protein n=1 Tax=Shinella sp. TaxID=1870904 RepID=UPI003F6EBC5A
MSAQKWNLKKAALYGIAFGFPIAILRAALGGVMPATFAETMGFLTGAMICGVVLFVGVAAIRNVLVNNSN